MAPQKPSRVFLLNGAADAAASMLFPSSRLPWTNNLRRPLNNDVGTLHYRSWPTFKQDRSPRITGRPVVHLWCHSQPIHECSQWSHKSVGYCYHYNCTMRVWTGNHEEETAQCRESSRWQWPGRWQSWILGIWIVSPMSFNHLIGPYWIIATPFSLYQGRCWAKWVFF